MKSEAETLAHYTIRQLLVIESVGQPDAAFGAAARAILQRLRSKLEAEPDPSPPALEELAR